LYSNIRDRTVTIDKNTRAYYIYAKDKSKAIVEIIEMDDPLSFLQKSKYDQKKK